MREMDAISFNAIIIEKMPMLFIGKQKVGLAYFSNKRAVIYIFPRVQIEFTNSTILNIFNKWYYFISNLMK